MLRRLLAVLGLIAFYCWWVEPSRLSITQHEVLSVEPPLKTPIRALLLTDFHAGRFSRPNVLLAKIKRLQRLHSRQPYDIVLLGGDFVDSDPRCLKKLSPAFGLLGQFGIPLFAVLGNHDYTSFSQDIAPLIEYLEAQSVTVLRNEAVTVTAGKQEILVVGLDDLQETKSYYDIAEYKSPVQYRNAAEALDWYAQFDNREPNLPRLLLAHNPDAVYLPGRKPLAVVAGHTHGGQVMFLDWIGRRLHRWLHLHLPPGSAVTSAGRRTVSGRTLIVSRGIGGAALPIRLFRTPEAIVVTFR